MVEQVAKVSSVITTNTRKTQTQVTKPEEGNWFTNWLNDKDKVSTDGKDDGKISFGEAAKSFGKGLMGIVKTAINHPIATTATIVAGVAITVATGGAALPILVAAGASVGVVQIGHGAYKAVTAKTDGEAKQAFETIGNGTFAVATSALSAKSALNVASKAGVTGADGAENLNTAQALVKCYKVTPEALSVSKTNIQTNFSTLLASRNASDVVTANSKTLKSATKYMSKPNDAQAYRFNPNGSEADILKNNPGTFRNAEGKYCIPNKWAPESPHIIDLTKEQMIMMYGQDDMAVCDGGIFKGSYVNSKTLKANSSLDYLNPEKLNYGEVIDVTKQAPGAYKIVPVGTKVKTLEGIQVVKEGQVVAIDHAGNPYVTPASNIIKRNILSEDAVKELQALGSTTK